MKMNLPAVVLSLCGVMALTYYSFTKQIDKSSEAQTDQLAHQVSEQPILTGNQTVQKAQNIQQLLQPVKTRQLWQHAALQQRPKDIPDNLYVEYIKVKQPGSMKLSEGEQVSLLIPQENKSFIGIIDESTRAYNGEITISSGTIENGDENASFSITEGENSTFITVATGESIYQVEINNQTGVGVVLDDRELNQYRKNEDGILPPPEGIS